MNELERLRFEVRKRRSDVTAKIGRIRRQTGVDIAGKREDPRRPTNVIKQYNSRQLKTYLNQLNAFQSRDVGFVAGAGGAPLPKQQWKRYKAIESRVNALGKAHEAKVADIFLPTSGMTLRQRNAMIHPTAVGEVVNRPYTNVERKPSQVPGSKALEKLIRDMTKKTKKSYLPKEIKKARFQAMEMFKSAGMHGVMERMATLSNSRFDTLWNYTNFATQLSLSYELAKLRAADAKERWHDQVISGAEEDMADLLDWAEGLPDK